MLSPRPAFPFTFLASLVLASCSGDPAVPEDPASPAESAVSGAGGAGGVGGAGGSGSDPTPPGSCARPGDQGNARGVGEYCTPGGNECFDNEGANACLADFGQDQWFCTKVFCVSDADCGDEAVCHHAGQGSACVPLRCYEGSGGAGGSLLPIDLPVGSGI